MGGGAWGIAERCNERRQTSAVGAEQVREDNGRERPGSAFADEGRGRSSPRPPRDRAKGGRDGGGGARLGSGTRGHYSGVSLLCARGSCSRLCGAVRLGVNAWQHFY